MLDGQGKGRADLIDDPADPHHRHEIVARHNNGCASIAKRLGDKGDVGLVQRTPVAAVDEEQDGRRRPGEKHVKEVTSARAVGVAYLRGGNYLTRSERAAPQMFVIDLFTLRMTRVRRGVFRFRGHRRSLAGVQGQNASSSPR